MKGSRVEMAAEMAVTIQMGRLCLAGLMWPV
jgi:hypothetical protein